jgi:hypothetical protein
MRYSDLEAIINKTNQQYAGGDDAAKQAAVAERLAAVERYNKANAAPAPVAPAGPPPPPPPPPVPPLPTFTRMTAPDKNIKPAPTDIIQFNDDIVDIALIQDLLYEDIGAVELANISRNDLIDGQDVLYSPIRNLSSIRREFNPNNIIATSYATDYFSRFGIDLDSRGVYEPYFDEDGNLIIEVETVGDGEEIQVQIVASGTIDLIEEL